MFYKDFADDYEKIFPFSDSVYSFLKNYMGKGVKEILDIGCATGHYCGKLASEGYEPTGIDLDSEMIKTAIENYKKPQFNVLNLTEIEKLPHTYDFAYSTGNVMAHVPMTGFELFLDALKEKLTPHGIWIFQVINWDYILTLKEFNFPDIDTESKIFHRKYTDILSENLVFNTELINKTDGISVFKDKVNMYPLSSDAYIKMHEDKGFKLLDHFANYSKKKYTSLDFSANIFVFQL